jgi:hypothetical protein
LPDPIHPVVAHHQIALVFLVPVFVAQYLLEHSLLLTDCSLRCCLHLCDPAPELTSAHLLAQRNLHLWIAVAAVAALSSQIVADRYSAHPGNQTVADLVVPRNPIPHQIVACCPGFAVVVFVYSGLAQQGLCCVVHLRFLDLTLGLADNFS